MSAASQNRPKLREAIDALDPARLALRTSEKWNTYPPDVLAAWVAEMDFPLCDAVRATLERALDHDDLGYNLAPDQTGLREAFAERMATRFGWVIDPLRVDVLTDVMQGLYIALDCFTEPGAGVIVQTPVYPPFLKAVRQSGRSVIENHLVAGATRFEIDFDDLRAGFEGGARTLLLCNPQNPTGRVLERGELERIAALVCEFEGCVISDEIHADLTFGPREHVPIASLNDDIAARSVTLNSASKSFNIPALRCAVAHFGSAELARSFLAHVPRRVRGGLGLLGLEATVAAWRHGDDWLDEIVAILDENRRHLAGRLAERFPELAPFTPEGTYMTWIDCAPLRIDGSPAEHFRERGRVALTDGRAFGTGYRQYARINFATSTRILDEVVERMARALGR